MEPKVPTSNTEEPAKSATEAPSVAKTPILPEEFGGNGKAEPTRYGDWEINGKCVDF